MRAITYTRTGPPSVLCVSEREPTGPGRGEVQVRIAVAGVNPTDWKFRSGAMGEPAFDEVVPGQDGAGVVTAVGVDAGELTVGQRVWVYLAQHQRPGGTAQELTVLPAARVVPLAESASFNLGASLGVPAVTAHRCLTVAEGGPARLAPGALHGRTVLVAGGAGAVGHAAIQLARWSGATVLSTVSSPEKAELATAAGAHHVVDYVGSDAAAAIRGLAPDGVDLVVEVAPAQNATLNAAVLAPRASIAVYANNGGQAMTLDVRAHMGANVRYQFVLLYTVGEGALAVAVADVQAAVAGGALEVGRAHGLPLHHFPLARAADAHAAVEAGAVGKVLLEVAAASDPPR